MLFIVVVQSYCIHVAFLSQVLPEFLQVEAFSKLSTAIGKVS